MGRRKVYCVEDFKRTEAGYDRGHAAQHASETAARRAGRARLPYASGAVIYLLEGYPDHDAWSEPEVLAALGDVPKGWREKVDG